MGCFGSELYHGRLNAPKKKLHPCAPEAGFTKMQANGARHTRILSAKAAPGSCAMGLEGREAVAPSIKNMHGMFFIDGVTEPPQSPVFCGTACSFPRRGSGGGLLTAAKFRQVAEQKMRPN
jgi:hypothetical protein